VTDPGYYDQSVPPALLVGGRRAAPARTASRPATADQQPSPLLVTAGTPGRYSPAGRATDRPHNVTALNTAGAVADPSTPWTAGKYVQVGTSGKRAHWNGEEWRGGESPGYPATTPRVTEAAQPATQEAPATEPRHAAPETRDLPPAPYEARPQFPGDEQPGDLTR
jgi:hypothetical protein